MTASTTLPHDDDRLVRIDEIAELVGLGMTATKGLVRESDFPVQVRVNPRVIRWWRSEVLEWLETAPCASCGFGGNRHHPHRPSAASPLMAARNRPIATWDVQDADGRPLRLYRPTRSCAYLSATWYEPGHERQQRTTLGTVEADARRWCSRRPSAFDGRNDAAGRTGRCSTVGNWCGSTSIRPTIPMPVPRTVTKQRNLVRAFLPEMLLVTPCELWTTEAFRDALLVGVPGHQRSYLQDARNIDVGLGQDRRGAELLGRRSDQHVGDQGSQAHPLARE